MLEAIKRYATKVNDNFIKPLMDKIYDLVDEIKDVFAGRPYDADNLNMLGQ